MEPHVIERKAVTLSKNTTICHSKPNVRACEFKRRTPAEFRMAIRETLVRLTAIRELKLSQKMQG